MRPACSVQKRLNTRQEKVGENFTLNRKQCYPLIAAAVCLGAFSMVLSDNDAIFSVRRHMTRPSNRQEDGMENSGYGQDSEFE